MMYEPVKNWKFTYIILEDGQYEIFMNNHFCCYCDPDNFEDSEKLYNGEITEYDLFKIMVDNLIEDDIFYLYNFI